MVGRKWYWRKKIGYSKTFTTDEKGKIAVTKLKLGTYKYKEVKAPEGYVLDETVVEFKLSYKDQNTAVVGTSAKSYQEWAMKLLIAKVHVS